MVLKVKVERKTNECKPKEQEGRSNPVYMQQQWYEAERSPPKVGGEG